MRSDCALWAVYAALALLMSASADPLANAIDESEDFNVAVYGIGPDASETSGAALAGVAALVLQTAGLHAEPQTPPVACITPNAVPDACVAASLSALSAGRAHAVLMPVRATGVPSAPRLRDSGLEELGDAAPPWRRTCLVTAPPARSLLDLADPLIASAYHLTQQDLNDVGYRCQSKNCTFVPERCSSENVTCASLLTSDESEKNVLAVIVSDNDLYANVISLGPRFLKIVERLENHALLVCDQTLHLASLGHLPTRVLGPPPCQGTSPCPFEANRLIKIANVRLLARYPSALRSLVHLSFTAEELANLTSLATSGPEAAAHAYVATHPSSTWPGEARVAVLLPASTMRVAYEASSFEAAAELVERELENERQPRAARFKVEVFDDACSAPRAYKYLTDALGTGEYGALSALAGPACGAAFADVARQSPAHALPVLAYTPQAPPPPPATALALLAAGDARQYSELWAALLTRMRWRRLGILSEPATHPSLDVARLQTYDVTHFELVDDGTNIHKDLISQWAKRAATSNIRIVYVCLEDAREVRAALCAGHAAGLTPSAGTVWLLPGTLPDGWLQQDHAETDECGALAVVAEGHLRAVPAWLAEWGGPQRADWEKRCPGCRPRAALLYDALRLWAAALRRLLAAKPTSLDDLHRPDLVRTLINDLTSTNYTGLTGTFKWASTDGVHARLVPLVIQQWRNGSYIDVGRWNGSDLSLDMSVLRWQTSDGRIPDDGSENCGLQQLADLLGGDCRTAFIALAALLLAALVTALASLAVYCRRRTEREYRAHLEALRLRTYGLKPGGLDRWELPRERVVINRKLGTGAFGTVYGGHALLAEDRGWTAVAVKTLKAGASTEEKLDFLSEAEAMKRFDHKNVVRLLGVVTKTEPVCTVMEFMLYGDLKNYLLARRHLAIEGGFGAESNETAEEVSPRRLTSMALDVARALSYLAQLRYVHRDVAARNCLVSAHRVVKLADFGMTRLVFENDYYRFSRKGMLPVRWMAPESLALGVFSPASDVWSFGVLLYEIVTFGSLPFQGLSNSEVLARVKAGNTLELPTGLKPQLEGLIKSCWRQDYKTRPAASEVTAFLADSPRLLTPCLDVPLDSMPLDAETPWRTARDRAEARWVSWAAPPSAATDTTYLSADGQVPQESDVFLP